jgi:hypothetical protein
MRRTLAFLSVVVLPAVLLAGCGKEQTPVMTSAAGSQNPPSVVADSDDTPSTTIIKDSRGRTYIQVLPGASQQVASAQPVDRNDYVGYAQSLGGVSHQGETIHLVVGAVADTQQEAQTLLEGAQAAFGDQPTHFIVQKSDNFEGMEPGNWLVIEGYAAYPPAENIEFGKQVFPDATVQKAKVLTTDPIPVLDNA